MIVDVRRFLTSEKPYWDELERLLDDVEAHAERGLELDEARRFHYLYQRASSGLAQLARLPCESAVREYLEGVVARAYAEIHETREKTRAFRFAHWFLSAFPQTFRRHRRAFALSLGLTLVGAVLGGAAICLDLRSKAVLLPFENLQGDPSDRVRQEEAGKDDRLSGGRTHFSAWLMTHNTRVAIFTMALGMTFGVGTFLLLFQNGILLGAVLADYFVAGEGRFAMAWLMPHGVIEIPAILIAGQAGFVLAGALTGRGDHRSVSVRLRTVMGDVVTLIFGVAVLLVWAGIVEAFLSQYHEPVVPYGLKIAFGFVELAALTLLLAKCGAVDSSIGEPRDRAAR